MNVNRMVVLNPFIMSKIFLVVSFFVYANYSLNGLYVAYISTSL